jgi:hypothetical protein
MGKDFKKFMGVGRCMLYYKHTTLVLELVLNPERMFDTYSPSLHFITPSFSSEKDWTSGRLLPQKRLSQTTAFYSFHSLLLYKKDTY